MDACCAGPNSSDCGRPPVPEGEESLVGDRLMSAERGSVHSARVGQEEGVVVDVDIRPSDNLTWAE
jgi:hypothetical protein